MVKIFLSSTYRDLQAHRQAVLDVLHKAGELPLTMETFGARSEDATTASLDEVRNADLFIGLYADRYGYRPDGDRSITEMEYHEATGSEIDRLIYIAAAEADHPLLKQHADTDPESVVLLNIFKRRLQNEHVVGYFTTPDDLAQQILLDLLKWMKRRSSSTTGSAPPATGTQINVGSAKNSSIIGNISGGTQHFNSQSNDKDDD